MFFVSADSKRVTGEFFVSADSKGLADGQFRPKQGKTRNVLVSADSKGVRGANVLAVERSKMVEEN